MNPFLMVSARTDNDGMFGSYIIANVFFACAGFLAASIILTAAIYFAPQNGWMLPWSWAAFVGVVIRSWILSRIANRKSVLKWFELEVTIFIWGVWVLEVYAAFYCGLWSMIHPAESFTFDPHWKNVLFIFGGLLALGMIKHQNEIHVAIKERMRLFAADRLPATKTPAQRNEKHNFPPKGKNLSEEVEKTVTAAKRLLPITAADTLTLRNDAFIPQAIKYRIDDYEWCGPDYGQILIWASSLGVEPEQFLNLLFREENRRLGTSPDGDLIAPAWDGPAFLDGKLLKLTWNLFDLPVEKIEWVNGLEITHFRILTLPSEIHKFDLGALPLPRLAVLQCKNLGLEHLTTSQLQDLVQLDCGNNELNMLDLVPLRKLRHLTCYANNLTQLDLKSVPMLENLECDMNDFTDLDLSGTPFLRLLSCEGGKLERLNLLCVPRLEVLNCSQQGQMQELDIRALGQLKELKYDVGETLLIFRPDQIITKCEKGKNWFTIEVIPLEKVVDKAFDEFNSGSPDKGIQLYRFAAERGHAVAQRCLGEIYQKGNEASSDYAEAPDWYRMAAEQGDSFSQNKLGEFFWLGEHGLLEDEDEAAKWYHKAAKQNYVEAQFRLGHIYFNRRSWVRGQSGKLVKDRNWDRVLYVAFQWYLKAADQGHVEAQCQVAFCYEFGLGVSQDDAKSFHYLRLAGENGCSEAWQQLGHKMIYGTIHTKSDPQTGFEYMRKAAENGDGNAAIWLSKLYLSGRLNKSAEEGGGYVEGVEVTPNTEESTRWLRVATESDDDTQGHVLLAKRYLDGIGVAQDFDEAAYWLFEAAECEDGEAMFMLGQLYQKGIYVTKDEEEAAVWYRLAAESLSREDYPYDFYGVARRLASCYTQGIGVPKDLAEAYMWLKFGEDIADDEYARLDSLYGKISQVEIAEGEKRYQRLIQSRKDQFGESDYCH